MPDVVRIFVKTMGTTPTVLVLILNLAKGEMVQSDIFALDSRHDDISKRVCVVPGDGRKFQPGSTNVEILSRIGDAGEDFFYTTDPVDVLRDCREGGKWRDFVFCEEIETLSKSISAGSLACGWVLTLHHGFKQSGKLEYRIKANAVPSGTP
jgi:hypothetical protein